MSDTMKTQLGARFLDLQAAAGITKHIGGYEATDELLSLCCIEQAHEVLNIGCGVGGAERAAVRPGVDLQAEGLHESSQPVRNMLW